ncbi:cytoskeleton organisation protein (Dec1), putative [Talaromyces stipitatus ATCC 10500]|uniref:Cytoskeleton organisation protein (Dec1), putative n=1 Tax=Talaromyces stipitatus (strain ATCC 10500 / CBS 375.48 / QM 6759 / NRRL 1006) TaxID=441959 RepID=B8MKB9_TALSN|nr:cytoskeleton organization protein (Dec1), putative [Talaromyces stipitatus ATCC 10500]EED15274.1 cytoskeleton organisation protein (Dec1), putative [Talaromyces stipitatus ATCC 10500]
MSATADPVFQRRNKQIQEAIDSHNLKQALQLIDKRIKKGEDTRFLRAWKAHILFLHPDQTHSRQGIAATLEICKLDPPTTDLDTIDLLNSTLNSIKGHEDTARGLWEKAAKTKPQDHEIQSQWFIRSFEGEDWKSAQKAAMSLNANFPKQRKYYLWAIFLCHLLAVNSNSSESERKLFGTLAYRMISKAAENVPADPKELLSPPRAIQTAEELILLIKIFQSQGRDDEALKILNSDNLGLNSRLVQNDWSFIREKLLALERAEKWMDGLGYAKELLTMPDEDESAKKLLQERDDWGVWSLLLDSTKKMDDKKTCEDTVSFVQKFAQRFPKSRNAHLARLEVSTWRLKSGELAQSDYLADLRNFYDSNSTKMYCFDDIRKYASRLDPTQILELVDYALEKAAGQKDVSVTAQQITIINAYKLDYCFKVFSGPLSSRKRVEAFVSRCLTMYRAMKKEEATDKTIENQPRDDLGLLAVTALIRLNDSQGQPSQEKPPTAELIRSAAILEYLCQNSPHNYQILLLLVRVYLLLGAGSIAMKTFSKLSVKQIQNETVAHNLYTRIATIHPLGAPPIEAEFKDFIPEVALSHAINFYDHADRTATRQRTMGLNLGSYANVEGTIELQQSLRNSICRRMWALEARRLDRLQGKDRFSRFDDIILDESEVVDKRTFDAFMNCEPLGAPSLEERLRLGPLPKKRWISATGIIDKIWGLNHQLLSQKPIKPDTALPDIEILDMSDVVDDMTLAERSNAEFHRLLLKATLLLSDSKSVVGQDINKIFNQMEEWVSKTLQSVSDEADLFANTTISVSSEGNGKRPLPFWQYLHTSILLLETLKVLSSTISLLETSSKKLPKSGTKPSKEAVQGLKEAANKLQEQIKSNTRTLRSSVIGSGVLGALTDLIFQQSQVEESNDTNNELANELEQTLDASAVEVFCGELLESWEEALGGVLSIK